MIPGFNMKEFVANAKQVYEQQQQQKAKKDMLGLQALASQLVLGSTPQNPNAQPMPGAAPQTGKQH